MDTITIRVTHPGALQPVTLRLDRKRLMLAERSGIEQRNFLTAVARLFARNGFRPAAIAFETLTITEVEGNATHSCNCSCATCRSSHRHCHRVALECNS